MVGRTSVGVVQLPRRSRFVAFHAAGIKGYLFEGSLYAIFAWYCMHVEEWAMSDKLWASDWLANDVIGMGIDVRVPNTSMSLGTSIRYLSPSRKSYVSEY